VATAGEGSFTTGERCVSTTRNGSATSHGSSNKRRRATTITTTKLKHMTTLEHKQDSIEKADKVGKHSLDTMLIYEYQFVYSIELHVDTGCH